MATNSQISRTAAEQWFDAHGLPYFADGTRARIRSRLSRSRLTSLGVVAATCAGAAGIATWLWLDRSTALLAAMIAAAVPVLVYALRALHGGPVARWAVGRTLSSLGLMFPLVTRALPLLLLFVTFLFINTEVWQVASSLEDGVLWVAVLLFASVGVAFLLVKLPEELDQVDDQMTGASVVVACAGTPLEDDAVAVAAAYDDATLVARAQVSGLAKANLVLVLLISQALQVLLLSVAMFGFFVVFGSVAINADVIEMWLGHPPHPFVDAVPAISHELVRVSTFLAAFSGLYFTVYAVSDENYRAQFFGALAHQLRRAVGVRTVYRCLAEGDDDPR